MEWKLIHLQETDSTNRWLRQWADTQPASACAVADAQPSSVCVVADYQSAGRGCGTNRWESERGQNLLFSLLLHPERMAANRQFQLSMAVSLAISETLDQIVGDISIKWPNDIYWRGGKICGILIEHTLQGAFIKDSIVGVGLNVNQQQFLSDAPNPVSLWQITGHTTGRKQLLSSILQRMDSELRSDDLRRRYMSRLYRRKGLHPYVDAGGAFMAQITDVTDDGHLLLTDDNGRERRYAFKEVQFVI